MERKTLKKLIIGVVIVVFLFVVYLAITSGNVGRFFPIVSPVIWVNVM